MMQRHRAPGTFIRLCNDKKIVGPGVRVAAGCVCGGGGGGGGMDEA